MEKRLILFILFLFTQAFPCASCFSPLEKDTTQALSQSVFFLVGVTAVVLVFVTYLILQAIKSAPQK